MNNLESRFSHAINLMNAEVAYYEKLYGGKFAALPHVGLGNRKTRCVNEATLPIITCDPKCLERCAGTCYVLAICTLPRPSCRKCEARNTVLRRIDPIAYYEHFFREAERLRLPIRLSDGGDLENEEQACACLQASRAHPEVHAILYTKRVELLPLLSHAPESLHIRYSAWEGDAAGEARARGLGFDVTRVVFDGTGNCPYQKSLAKFNVAKRATAARLRESGADAKTANRQAEKMTAEKFPIWHCRNCAEAHCGCCAKGEIRFNVVGGANWALKAMQD